MKETGVQGLTRVLYGGREPEVGAEHAARRSSAASAQTGSEATAAATLGLDRSLQDPSPSFVTPLVTGCELEPVCLAN
jgi:hypothetical protein